MTVKLVGRVGKVRRVRRVPVLPTIILATIAPGSLLAQQKEQPPAAGPTRDFRLPPRQVVTLANGIKLSMVRYGTVPKVAISVQIQTGMIDEGPDEVQLSALTADLLTEGTTTRSGPDISRQAAEMGGTLNATAGTDAVTIGGEALSEFADRFIALAADVAQHPRFAEADVSRLRANRLRQNAIALSSPDEQARQLFRKTMFGEHPYGNLYPPESMLKSYNAERVRAFYTKNVGARRVRIYVSGVFDPAAVERAARAGFASWAAGPEPTLHPPMPLSRRRLETLDRPGAVQSVVWVGLPVANPSNPDWIGFNVTDALLGGAFGSRITRNIREDKGYTYSPFSFVWARPRTALWIEAADVTTNVTGPSLKEIFGEIDRLRTEAPPAAELTGIKNNLAGIFVIQNNSRNGVINQLEFVDQHGLGDAYLAGYVRNVMAVTPEQVKSLSLKYLDPAKMLITVVGDQKIVGEQLEPYRPKVP